MLCVLWLVYFKVKMSFLTNWFMHNNALIHFHGYAHEDTTKYFVHVASFVTSYHTLYQ